MTSEKNALPDELANIVAEAEAIEPPQAADPNAPAPVIVDRGAEVKMTIDMLADGLKVIYPRTGNVLTDEKRAQLVAVYVPLAEKYGFTFGGFMAKYGIEISAAYSTVMILPPMLKAIQEDRAEQKAAENQTEAAKRTADPQPMRTETDPYTAAFAAAEA